MTKDIREAMRTQGAGTAALDVNSPDMDPSSYMMALVEQALQGMQFPLDTYRLKPYSGPELNAAPRVSIMPGNMSNANQPQERDPRSDRNFLGGGRPQGQCYRCGDGIIADEVVIVDYHMGECEANIKRVNRMAWDVRARLYSNIELNKFRLSLQDSLIANASQVETTYLVRSDTYQMNYKWLPTDPFTAHPI